MLPELVYCGAMSNIIGFFFDQLSHLMLTVEDITANVSTVGRKRWSKTEFLPYRNLLFLSGRSLHREHAEYDTTTDGETARGEIDYRILLTVSIDYCNLFRSADLQCCTRSALSRISTSKRSSSCSTRPFRYCRLLKEYGNSLSSIQDIDDRWCDGVGPLAECLTVIEVYCASNSIDLSSDNGRYICLIIYLYSDSSSCQGALLQFRTT